MALPLHWRVRLGMWLPALAGAGLAASFGPWHLVVGAIAVLAAALVLWGEPVVDAVRDRHAAGSAPAEPPPAPDGAALLANALAQGAVTVMYRPLRSLPELRLCGVEAELRWRHPLAGWLPLQAWPAALPPGQAERALDRWLVGACTQFVRWSPRLDSRDEATLWLALPPAWLELPGLEAAFERAATVSGLAPQRLRLRITPQLQGHTATLPEVGQRLRLLGFGLVADAFGAGPSSLAHLNALPVQAVCLDRSFVERAAHAVPQRLVVESTARLAASRGMQMLADGVTTESQVLALGAMGCQLGLGDVCGPWLEADEWSQRWSQPREAEARLRAA